MSKKTKKKKNKNKDISVMCQIDSALNSSYNELQKEIEEFQMRLAIADQEARKKAKKAMKKKKNKNEYYNTEDIRKNVRTQMVKEIEGNNFLDRCMSFLHDLGPILTIITRLIASLILSILSITSVKVRMKPETYQKFKNIYDMAMRMS